MMLILLLLLRICVSEVHSSGYYFVIAPNVIRFDQDETVTVSVFGEENAAVKIWLEHKDKQFSEKNVIVMDQASPVHTTVKVTEKDIFTSYFEKKPRKVKLCSEWKGTKHSREIILSYHSGYLIVQTDKPIYTPLQKVKIRALALDESLKAVDGWQVGMYITSPSNLTLSRHLKKQGDTGFFQNNIHLPPYPEMGIWTAKAFYDGQFETESHVLFEVREYVLPTFEVTIEVDIEFLVPTTTSLTITVEAKYVYGKPVQGNARLTLKLKSEEKKREFILDVGRQQLETRKFGGSVTEFEIKVDKILNSPLLSDKSFPYNKRLEVIAIVHESATGNEEVQSHDRTIFTENPFVFKFTKSKQSFRPDFEYYLEVELQYVNGKPASKQNVSVRFYEDGKFKKEQSTTTNDDGRATCIFKTSKGINKISFYVTTSDNKKIETFEVDAYRGKSQILVEHVKKTSKTVLMRAYTKIQGKSYTGMLFVVVSRGKVVFTEYKEAADIVSVELSENLQELVSPDARLLVFYVDKSTREVVADSIKFEVERKCRGKGLHLYTASKEVLPGINTLLTINGTRFMHIGLNIMDKAVLLLNDINVLTKNKMFETLQSHDLGCGEGGGRSGADVFKKSGLTVITNAVVDEDDLIRTTDGCKANRRKRRDVNSCLYNAAELCCAKGYEFAETLHYEADHVELMNPYTSCYPRALFLAKEKVLSMECIMAFYKSCVDELEYLITDQTLITSKSLDDKSKYWEDIIEPEAVHAKNTRSKFWESWAFDIITLDKDGLMQRVINVPDSITEWTIQAIGITKDVGMCIADPVDLKAYRDFFIQLDLPYKATRFEHFNVKATIFNYGLPNDANKVAYIHLLGDPNFCYHSEPGKPSSRVKVELPPNSAHTVSFPMIPLKSGNFWIKVSAIVPTKGLTEENVIEKELYVVNEGIEEKETIVVCLDPMKQKDDCKNDIRVVTDFRPSWNERHYDIDLSLPKNSISGTGKATGYVQGSIMTNIVNAIIEGVDSLFQQPSGCGEQMMIRLAPTVYAMTYLKQTKQQTAELETKGNQWIRDGVNMEISQYRKADGSYAAWLHRTASTWLTAFVAKVFCQAKKVVDDAVDEEKDIERTIDWLNRQVEANGSVTDKMPVMDRKMIGQINESDHTLSAFILITLQECGKRSALVNSAAYRTRKYLEGLPEDKLTNNHYLLAISTYALALTNSNKTDTFLQYLYKIKRNNSEGTFWGNPGGKPANANSVETTAYALLALLQSGDIKTSSSIVSWLTSQRDGTGSFRSTQDTVVGLQALSQYSIVTYSPEIDLVVTTLADNWYGGQIRVNREDIIVQTERPNLLDETKSNKLTVRVKGTGSAIMSIDLRYNKPVTEGELCPFKVSEVDFGYVKDLPNYSNLTNVRNCDVCGHCDGDGNDPDVDTESDHFGNSSDSQMKSNFGRKKRASDHGARNKTCVRFSVSSKNNETFGMSIVKFVLETGVEVVKSDLEKLVKDNNTNIARYEMPSNGKGFIVFYLHKIFPYKTSFIFRLKDGFDGETSSRQPFSVNVYEYYNPDKHCTQDKGTGQNYRGKRVNLNCEKKQKECRCLQRICAQAVEPEIKRLLNQKKRPAVKLQNYACNTDKANYAVLVEIEDRLHIPTSQETYATGRVIELINQGKENLTKDDEMTFVWKDFCKFPDLKKGYTYIIIGLDGYRLRDSGKKEIFRYPLMGTSLVMEYKRKKMVQKNFLTLMKKSGCQNKK